MKLLEQRILKDGQYIGNGILKVDGFVNHQVDPYLMNEAGKEFAKLFMNFSASKILTAEISGIAPAVSAGLHLGIPVVFARKHKPITMPDDIYVATAPSHTKGQEVLLMVSPEFLGSSDKILIIDDFLETGHTILALVHLALQAGAEVIGVGAVIEKSFEGGRAQLEAMGLRVRSLAVIEKMTDNEIIFAQGVSP